MLRSTIILLSLILTTAAVSAQTSIPAATSKPVQPAEYIVSTAGIGPFRLSMSKSAIEKILNAKLKLPKFDANNYDMDTVSVKYKGLDISMTFNLTTTEVDTVPQLRLFEVWSSSPQLITRSGVAIGDDKLKIITTYSQYRLDIIPDYDKVLHPKRSAIYLYDYSTSNQLIFFLYDNLITGFGVAFNEGD
jgi:hypothetical protein